MCFWRPIFKLQKFLVSNKHCKMRKTRVTVWFPVKTLLICCGTRKLEIFQKLLKIHWKLFEKLDVLQSETLNCVILSISVICFRLNLVWLQQWWCSFSYYYLVGKLCIHSCISEYTTCLCLITYIYLHLIIATVNVINISLFQ
jgi:hypothetical protein